ncbi:MAG: selenium cofactor biosynthesis protein YqeC [Acutalibacteraceae bacterium]
MELAKALDVRPGVTAIIGGGGKTSLMECLAEELSAQARVIVCTTTHIYPEQNMPCLVSTSEAEIAAELARTRCVCVGSVSESGKYSAPELPFCTLCALASYVIVEADGSKRLPLKAHARTSRSSRRRRTRPFWLWAHPASGRPMRESVHRAPIAAQALDVSEDTTVTPELWAKFLNLEALHTRVLVNQAENEPERQTARALAAGLSCPVCMAALQKEWIECLC